MKPSRLGKKVLELMRLDAFKKRNSNDTSHWKDLLTNETQMNVAIDHALVTALEMIVWQKEAWNELVARLADNGLNVSITTEASEEYATFQNRLRACLVVVAQESSIPTDIMKKIGNEQ